MAVQVFRNVSKKQEVISNYLYKEPVYILSLLPTYHSIKTAIN